MSSIVIELQRDALNPQLRVPDLLRKALLVAKKLGKGEMESWLLHELEGYETDEGLPAYRRLVGQVYTRERVMGHWVPVLFHDQDFAKLMAERPIGQGVAALEYLVQNSKDGRLTMPYPPELDAMVLAKGILDLPPVLRISTASVVAILDAVRSTVLTWAMQLESDGILGEGLVFTEVEREKAASATYNTVNYFGDASGSQVQQHTQGSSQALSIKGFDTEAFREFVDAFRAALAAGALPDAGREEAEADLSTIEAQLKSPKPRAAVLRAALGGVRDFLLSAAGSAAAPALLEMLKALL